MVTAQPGFVALHRKPIAMSAVAHLLLLVALSSGLVIIPQQQPTPLALEAVVIDENAIRNMAAAEQRKRDDAARQERVRQEQEVARQREADAEKQRQVQAEQQRQAEAAAAERRAVEERQRADAQAAAERQRQADAEKQRKAAEAKAAAERKAAEEKAAAERKRQAELEKQRKAEEQARLEQERRAAEARAREEALKAEQARRTAELAAALEAEESLAAARQSDAMGRYLALIQQSVERKWQQPPSAVAGIECEVIVQQLPSGDVVDVRVQRCNADEVVRRSVENAVYAASPLPTPDDTRLFDRYLRFTFRPTSD